MDICIPQLYDRKLTVVVCLNVCVVGSGDLALPVTLFRGSLSEALGWLRRFGVEFRCLRLTQLVIQYNQGVSAINFSDFSLAHH